MKAIHNFPPVYNEESRVLILGTMPSPKSREEGFFYMHPQNRFWPTLAAVYGEEVPMGKEERKAFALTHHIALWDSIAECEIKGASDASVKDIVPNDIPSLCQKTNIKAIFCVGKLSYKCYLRYFKDKINLPQFTLPSSSPANCAVKMDQLIEAYSLIKKWTDEA